MNQPTVDGPDGRARCRWCAQAPEFLHYHDTEWGFPVTDDFRLFEKLSLESFQSGLSWRTILAKRENFRTAFEGFDYNKLAGFGPNDIERLLKNEGIVRHRGKIASVLHNAPIARDIATEHGSLAAFLWQYAPAVQPSDRAQTVSVSPESMALSKDLKRRGWKFLGPTTAYAFMQAMGLINDHVQGCVIRDKVETVMLGFERPAPR